MASQTNDRELIDMLAGVSLDPGHHTLYIEYPVAALLPDSTLPTLEPPLDMHTREAPPADQRRAGVTQSTFVVLVPVNQSPIDASQPSHDSTDLAAAIDALSRAGGRSTLQAVTYQSEEGQDLMYRFRLTTHFVGQGAQVSDFQLTSWLWAILLSSGRSPQGSPREWVKTVEMLQLRTTNRAYYHVRNRLVFDYSVEMAINEEAQWRDGWASYHDEADEQDRKSVDELTRLLGETGI